MTFKPKKIWTYSATQNDCLNLSFVKDMIVVDKMPRHREKWPIKANFVIYFVNFLALKLIQHVLAIG